MESSALASEFKLTQYHTVNVISSDERKEITVVEEISTGKQFIQKRIFSDMVDIYTLMQTIDCPYLARIYDVFRFGNSTCLIEEYIDGTPLSKLIRLNNPSSKQLKRIILQLAEAVKALHEYNIIHRDIKPANIMLCQNGNIKLMDYDIVRRCDAATATDEDTLLLGTKGYAAPEQFGFSQTDFRTDIYAFGVTLNELITGKKPSQQLATGRYRKIIKRCTAFDPAQRYQSTSDLIHAIRRVYISPRVMVLSAIIVLTLVVIAAPDLINHFTVFNTDSPLMHNAEIVPNADTQASSRLEPHTQQSDNSLALGSLRLHVLEKRILKTYNPSLSEMNLPSLLFLEDEAQSATIQMGDNIATSVTGELNDNILHVVLSNDNSEQFEFDFFRSAPINTLQQSGLEVHFEIVPLDLDGDSENELLIIAATRGILEHDDERSYTLEGGNMILVTYSPDKKYNISFHQVGFCDYIYLQSPHTIAFVKSGSGPQLYSVREKTLWPVNY